jgi:SAM-dependent methyltransferase
LHSFNQDYYENGVKKQISGYENYRWMPTRSIPEAMSIIDAVDFNSCLDFGCAKGYLVHALRLLGKNATGVDISEYAIANCHPAVKNNVFHLTQPLYELTTRYDLVIAKDVLEHVPEADIPETLRQLRFVAEQALFVIPLGDDNLFRIREYEIDKTHVTRKDEEWWLGQVRNAGFELVRFSYGLGSVKEKWKKHAHGNGFFHVK